MASKGQKFQKVSPEIKLEILEKYFKCYASPKMLGSEYGVSCKTIETWIYKSKAGIDVTVDHWKGNSGRPKTKNLTIEDYKERYEIANGFAKGNKTFYYTNAMAEGLNNQLKTIIKSAYGYHNFDRFRKRAMLIMTYGKKPK